MNKQIRLWLSVVLSLSIMFSSFSYADNSIVESVATDKLASYLNYQDLDDGKYSVDIDVVQHDNKKYLSMADDAIQKPAIVEVKNGKYYLQLTVKPIVREFYYQNLYGYLGDMLYKDKFGNFKTVDKLYFYDEKDDYFNIFKQYYSSKYGVYGYDLEQIKYPKTIRFPIAKPQIQNQELAVKVFVPVMESLMPNEGTKLCVPTIYWKTLQKISSDDSNDNSDNSQKWVKLDFEDGTATSPDVRWAVDDYAELITKNGRDYLRLTYYSEQYDDAGYDYGAGRLEYSYSKQNSSNSRGELHGKVFEKGDISGASYQISKVDIPLKNHNKIYLYGYFMASKYNNQLLEKYAVIRWQNVTSNLNKTLDLKYKALKQQGYKPVRKSPSDAKGVFDFVNKGVLYSPYTSKDRKSFVYDGTRKSILTLAFARESVQFNELRHIKYTLDGSNPNKYSSDANTSQKNNDMFFPTEYYEIVINPIQLGISKNGGMVTLKVKGYNNDFTRSTPIKTYQIPFGNSKPRENEGADVFARAKDFVDIASSSVAKQIYSRSKYREIKKLKNKLAKFIKKRNKSLTKVYKEKLRKQLMSGGYKYQSEQIEVKFVKFNKNQTSMSNKVLRKNATLLYVGAKTYLILDFKPMKVGNIEAHLRKLFVYKDRLDKEQFKVYSLSKYEATGTSSSIANFDERVVVEIDEPLQDEYAVRVDNDGMNSAPQARLWLYFN